jgi:hypothetical protein
MAEIKTAGPINSSLLDITHKCNLRCTGCYFYVEKMDQHRKTADNEVFGQFLQKEIERGINMLTIVGGEPSFEIDRLRMLAKHFKLTIVTNGKDRIPTEGLENVRLAISFWGDEDQDMLLRGRGKMDVFDQALQNYRNDKRAGFYYTIIPGFINNIEKVTKRMIDNGNYVTYNYYADLAAQGGRYSHKNSFLSANDVINQLIIKYPESIVSSPYVLDIIARGCMLDKQWGYDVCPSVTYDHPDNTNRLSVGNRYQKQFRAYNADLKTTRRCCIGTQRDCDTCVDLWAISGWIVGAMKAHLRSYDDFVNWLCSTYVFYLQTGFIKLPNRSSLLPEVYRKMGHKIRELNY